MNIKTILILIIFSPIFVFGQNPDEERVILKWQSYIVDDTLGKCTSFDMTESEISLADSLYQSTVSLYNTHNTKTLDPKKYKRQYFPFINSNGEKEVFINCLCNCLDEDADKWKKQYISIYGGGSCFFKLRINLTTNKLIYFAVNNDY